MTISAKEQLLALHNATRAQGTASVNSDGFIEIEGYEGMSLNIKQFPWPTLGVGGEIERPGPVGMMSFIPQQLKTAQQGPITFLETVGGSVMDFMKRVAASGGIFQCRVYEGTPENFSVGYKLLDCFFVPDVGDRDWENRTQLTMINGTLFYHYYGENIAGSNGAV